jgi:hypothetical protein
MYLESSDKRESKILTSAMKADEDYRRFRERLTLFKDADASSRSNIKEEDISGLLPALARSRCKMDKCEN